MLFHKQVMYQSFLKTNSKSLTSILAAAGNVLSPRPPVRSRIRSTDVKNTKSYSRRRAKSCKIRFTTHKSLPLENAEVSVPLNKWRQNVRELEEYLHLDDPATDKSVGVPLQNKFNDGRRQCTSRIGAVEKLRSKMGERLLESIVECEKTSPEKPAPPENVVDEYINSIVTNRSDRRNELFQDTLKMLEGD